MEKETQKVTTKTVETGDHLRGEGRAKRKNGLSGVTFAIVALSLVLASAVVLGVTGAYFTGTQSATGTITLGDPVNISITQGGSSVTTLTFNGNAMPGTVYDQAIAVSAPTATSDAVVRAKVELTNSDSATTNVTSAVAAGWTEVNTDGYYYYNGILTAGQSIDFITSITVPTSLTNEDANKTYAVSVIVEAIQHANGAAQTVWTGAPTDWTTNYGSGTTTGA